MSKKYKRNRAFSLIELLVVITIVGVLAAIAVPAYKTYQLKVRVAEVNSAILGRLAPVLTYYNVHGIFPNAQQLGITAPELVAPESASFTSGPLSDLSTANNYGLDDTCPVGRYFFTITSTSDLLGYIFYYYVALPNGTIVTKCDYSFISSFVEGAPSYGNMMTACVDRNDNDVYPAFELEMKGLAESCPE